MNCRKYLHTAGQCIRRKLHWQSMLFCILQCANLRSKSIHRPALIGFTILLAAAILLITLQSRAVRTEYAEAKPAQVDRDQVLESVLSFDGETTLYRFLNGNVSLATDRRPNLLEDHRLYNMALESLENQFEQMLMQSTACCSAYSRFVRRVAVEDRRIAAGHSVCMVGRFKPSQPCYSFSFGRNRSSWRFEEDLSSSQGCYAMAFDPALHQSSHMHSERVLLLGEGLGATSTKGKIRTDSYLGYLKRFKAEKAVIDVLKVDVWPGDWPSLETAARDGSLRLTKQLVLTIRSEGGRSLTAKELIGRILALVGLHNAGFRQWHLEEETTVIDSLSYININFVQSDTVNHQFRNKIDSKIDFPLKNLLISRSPGFDQLIPVLQANLSAMSPAELDHLYFKLVEQKHLFCPHSRRIGQKDDGGWDVCFSEPFSIDSASQCTAFSFGINYEWKYDDELADTFHCQVFMFDPSMTKVKDHRRRKTSWFHRTGLSFSNKTSPQGWKMRTLCELFEELLPENATIDILKIDVEYSEWAALEQALIDGCLTRVKQFLFETHTDGFFQRKSNYGRFVGILRSVFDLGFRTWRWHRNPFSRPHKSDSGLMRPCCYEHYLLNINFLE